ncbi:MAG: cytochrome-c peroxidase [Gemmataceae bacterium]
MKTHKMMIVWLIVCAVTTVLFYRVTLAETQRASSRMLFLPKRAYNYSQPDLPNHFQTLFLRLSDNTPKDNLITDSGATLGRVLFYDTKLSINGKLSCASCHVQEKAFADPRKVSVGFAGKKVDRNAMSLINTRYYPNGRFFWDERARTLEDQVLMPIENGTEMGHDLKKLVGQLAADPIYPELFQKAFGDSKITKDRVSKSLAQFVRSIVSYRSKYDKGIAKVESIFETFPNYTNLENEGKRLFLGRARCFTCHMVGNGPRERDTRRFRQSAIFYMPGPANNGIDGTLKVVDGGLGDITLNSFQFGEFKSPSLRNVEVTAPYMHDGRFETLEEVIDHYDKGVKNHPNLDRRLRGRNRRLKLNQRQKQALVAFLKTLTDHELLNDPKYSNPFEKHISSR